jgi:hypothetical protein
LLRSKKNFLFVTKSSFCIDFITWIYFHSPHFFPSLFPLWEYMLRYNILTFFIMMTF